VHIDLDKRFAVWYDRLTLFRAVRTILAIAIVLVLLAGLLERLVEPEVFTSLGLSYWWAVTTVTTVGYGDIVPESTGGRIVGAMLMLLGVSLIPTLTGMIVATLVGKRTRLQQEEMNRRADEQAAALERIEERIAELSGGAPGAPRQQG
jgi:voltage-gated potassium channel